MNEQVVQDTTPVTEPVVGQGKRALVRTIVEYVKTLLLTLLVALGLKTFVVEAFRIPSGSMENTLVVGDFLLVNKFAFGIRTPRTVPLTSIPLRSHVLVPWGSVRRGDIAVFEYPGEVSLTESEGQSNYVKRCIGVPGDTVRIHQGRVFVNGNEMTVPPHGRWYDRPAGDAVHGRIRMIPGNHGFTEEEFGPVVVPKRGETIELTSKTFDDWRAFILREGHRIHLGENDVVFIDGKPASSYTVERDYFFMLGDNRHNSLDSRFWGFVPEENLIGEALLVYWSWDPDVPVMSLGEKLGSIRWGRIGTLIR